MLFLGLSTLLSPSVTVHETFLYRDLTPEDQVRVAKTLHTASQIMDRTRCWRLENLNHKLFEGFSTLDKRTIKYKGVDARALLLAMTGQFAEGAKNVAVRKASCQSAHCLNPTHYYWGTREDVAYENAVREGSAIPKECINAMRSASESGESLIKISRRYRIPYHTTRRICKNEIFTDLCDPSTLKTDSELWGTFNSVCTYITERYPNEIKSLEFWFHVSDKLSCPWHRKGSDKHKGNFGLMGECLDCIEEIRAGRCIVDVREFDLDWYWTVKRFWEQVDIKGEDECWPWLGTTRRNNSESIAYFPSPHHSGKTQSAPRVAYWLSRGYTGKYKVFSRPDCQSFCCNPTHLTIREFKDMLPPSKIETIKLKHDNIFEHARKNLAQGQPGTAQ